MLLCGINTTKKICETTDLVYVVIIVISVTFVSVTVVSVIKIYAI